ncbi:4-hydroxybenzoyl-CoA reductase beta subunit [Paramagnetospirillum magnetotacticum MS-1]|uniref:4-hydroxybenzoyl-CoA reductase beta subunit n=1 Tax=Paramagnetospirillum magnetotacticum MS-1 TaxID=272627 RepID=A0A0C2YWA3_PARME|nr:FAD binding domain-containing protein [Paramagnetospirillum magnetotacticum]KIL99398.1 4-hydroxybenzoyl-CoA reductase beta subunit [Paramagnetospirillum magnetotacticum MS-1]
MFPFDYLRPQSLTEAIAAHDGEERRYLAGGQSLLAALKLRLAQPSALIDVARLPELAGMRQDDGALVVGAAVTHAQMAAITAIPALADLAGSIGDLQVRNMGTLGGALANADPASDHAAAVLGLGALIRTDRRVIPADAFFLGMFETSLEPGELIVSVSYPLPRRAGYAKTRNPASGYPVVGVFVAETESGVRVAVTGAASCPFRLTGFEMALEGDYSTAALEGLTFTADDLSRDLHASAEYRAALIPVLARRALGCGS